MKEILISPSYCYCRKIIDQLEKVTGAKYFLVAQY